MFYDLPLKGNSLGFCITYGTSHMVNLRHINTSCKGFYDTMVLFGIIYDYVYVMSYPMVYEVMFLGMISLHHGS